MKISLDEIIANFNGLALNARLGIFGAVIFLFIIVDYFLLMNLQLGFIHGSSQEIASTSQEIARVSSERQRIMQMRKGLDESRIRFQMMSEKVRSMQEVSTVLGEISKVAIDSGIKIEQVIPQKDLQETLITSGDKKFFALPIFIQAQGGYHAFGKFLNRLEAGNLYFSVKELKIEVNPKDRVAHLVTITIKVILFDTSTAEPAK